jgi:hypothetical protein
MLYLAVVLVLLLSTGIIIAYTLCIKSGNTDLLKFTLVVIGMLIAPWLSKRLLELYIRGKPEQKKKPKSDVPSDKDSD